LCNLCRNKENEKSFYYGADAIQYDTNDNGGLFIMQDIMLYIIISILLIEILCGGILGSILIKRMSHMGEIIRKYERETNKEKTVRQPVLQGPPLPMLLPQQQVVTLTKEEREMLNAPIPGGTDTNQEEEDVIEEFLI
jgi:hypothetical protein